jgi:hypothetical protein
MFVPVVKELGVIVNRSVLDVKEQVFIGSRPYAVQTGTRQKSELMNRDDPCTVAGGAKGLVLQSVLCVVEPGRENKTKQDMTAGSTVRLAF